MILPQENLSLVSNPSIHSFLVCSASVLSFSCACIVRSALKKVKPCNKNAAIGSQGQELPC